MVLIGSVLLCLSYQQVPASFFLSSLDEGVISVLAEVICISALQTTERHFLNNLLGQTSNNFFKWFHKPKSVASKDSSVIMYELFEDEIVENAKNLLENFNSMKANYKCIETKTKYHWWTSSAISKLEKIGGPEFSTWTSEYIPAYRLQIDPDKLKSVKFEGWKRSAENRWEVLLTHSQMVRPLFLDFICPLFFNFICSLLLDFICPLLLDSNEYFMIATNQLVFT